MDLVDRLKEFIHISGYTSTQFADQAQISRATLSQILSGRNKKISNELIAKLHVAFPSLDIMWLLFGENSSPSSMTDENRLFVSDTKPERMETDVEDSKELNFESKSMSERKIQDDEIVTFANSFFPKASPITKKPSKNDNPTVEDVNDSCEKKLSLSRRVTSIVIFYSDGTFEKVKTT